MSSPYQKIAACKEWAHSDNWFLRCVNLFGSNNRKVYKGHAHVGFPLERSGRSTDCSWEGTLKRASYFKLLALSQIAIESLIMESGLNDKVQLDYMWVWFPVLALPVSVVSCSCLCGQDSVCLVPTPPPPLGEWTCSPAGSTALKSRLSISATTLSAPLR